MTPINFQTVAFFERLPVDVIGNILDQLNRVTGSKGIVNEADIPVIIRYARSLACTSKKMAANVNHPYVTHLFLESLSHKYDESNAHFAALFNTIGARKWMWNHIRENGDDKVYQGIQEIYELASHVLKEAKHAGLKFEYSEGREGWPSPNPFYYQTKQGLALYIDWSPSHLATPFGEVKIYGGGSSSDDSPLSVAELFIKRLNAVFQHVDYGGSLEGRDKGHMFEIAVSSEQGILRKISAVKEKKQISEKEVKSKKGTKNLIINDACGNYTVYNIGKVKGEKVPNVVWYDVEEATRSYELIKRMWEMLEADRLGRDPIAKEIKNEKVVPESKFVKRFLFNNSSEVSEWGIKLVTKLVQQPTFPKRKATGETKVLVLKYYSDARIIEILNDAAKQFLAEDSGWHIHAFGCGDNRRSVKGKDLGNGLELWIRKEHAHCPIDALKIAYDSVIKDMGQNWVKSALKDHSAILHAKSEEDYVLLVKKESTMYEEDVLIRFLADPLDLSTSISCYRDWKDGTSGLYLWIRKDHLEKTLAALNIIL